jgi:hypothetical protein
MRSLYWTRTPHSRATPTHPHHTESTVLPVAEAKFFLKAPLSASCAGHQGVLHAAPFVVSQHHELLLSYLGTQNKECPSREEPKP